MGTRIANRGKTDAKPETVAGGAKTILVLMDVVMPKMGGREAHEKIKALRSSLPVVFSTGYTFEIIDTTFLEEHRVKIISKPCAAHQLCKTVREGLDEGSGVG